MDRHRLSGEQIATVAGVWLAIAIIVLEILDKAVPDMGDDSVTVLFALLLLIAMGFLWFVRSAFRLDNVEAAESKRHEEVVRRAKIKGIGEKRILAWEEIREWLLRFREKLKIAKEPALPKLCGGILAHLGRLIPDEKWKWAAEIIKDYPRTGGRTIDWKRRNEVCAYILEFREEFLPEDVSNEMATWQWDHFDTPRHDKYLAATFVRVDPPRPDDK